jgi:hypothetical protein
MVAANGGRVAAVGVRIRKIGDERRGGASRLMSSRCSPAGAAAVSAAATVLDELGRVSAHHRAVHRRGEMIGPRSPGSDCAQRPPDRCPAATAATTSRAHVPSDHLRRAVHPDACRGAAGRARPRHPGYSGLARASADHQHRRLHGAGAEPVQGLLAIDSRSSRMVQPVMKTRSARSVSPPPALHPPMRPRIFLAYRPFRQVEPQAYSDCSGPRVKCAVKIFRARLLAGAQAAARAWALFISTDRGAMASLSDEERRAPAFARGPLRRVR